MTTHTRPRRAFWGDIRFFIGIALVVISIAGVWLIVSSARDTTPALQANRTIVLGEALVSGDFDVVDVSLGAMTDTYLSPQQLEPGAVAARTLVKGELVPLSAAIEAKSTRVTTLVVQTSTGVPSGISAGRSVELWHAPPLAAERGFDSPRVLVADVVVGKVIDDDSVIAQGQVSVELVLERTHVAEVLTAITNGSALSLVPVGSGA